MRHEAKPHRTAVGQHWVVVLDVDRRGPASLAGAVPRQAALLLSLWPLVDCFRAGS